MSFEFQEKIKDLESKNSNLKRNLEEVLNNHDSQDQDLKD